MWTNFGFHDSNNDKPTCKICFTDILCETGNTTNLSNYLKRKHGLDDVSSASTATSAVASSISPTCTKSKQLENKSLNANIPKMFNMQQKLSASSNSHKFITQATAALWMERGEHWAVTVWTCQYFWKIFMNRSIADLKEWNIQIVLTLCIHNAMNSLYINYFVTYSFNILWQVYTRVNVVLNSILNNFSYLLKLNHPFLENVLDIFWIMVLTIFWWRINDNAAWICWSLNLRSLVVFSNPVWSQWKFWFLIMPVFWSKNKFLNSSMVTH